MFAQIAQALKNPTGIDPMGGLDVQRIVATGQSQSARKLDDYLMQWQGGLRRARDRRVPDPRPRREPRGSDRDRSEREDDARAAAQQRQRGLSEQPERESLLRAMGRRGRAHSSFWIGCTPSCGGAALRGRPQLPATADDDLHAGNPPYVGYATWNYGEQLNPGSARRASCRATSSRCTTP
jgi:hypothetical protein